MEQKQLTLEFMSKARWFTAIHLIKRDGLKPQTAIYGPLSLAYDEKLQSFLLI
jgi:hypothetical protein